MSEITMFVHDALAAGKSRVEIHDALADAGWREDEVANALDEFADTQFAVPVPRRKPRLSARDTFWHLLAFLTLYISALATGTMLFQFVNMMAPDPLQHSEWQSNEVYTLLRTSAASLVIALPIYLLMTIKLQTAYNRDPEQRTSGVRKWLTYITLFVASTLVICYLIALVYELLSGELAGPFIVKVAIVVAIAGAVFGYYIPGLRGEEIRRERQGPHGLSAAV